jgi:oxygen-dependent protoporphyrinogen oxidase
MRVVVVGGGPAGCAGAYRLSQLGHEVVLLERERHVGGRTWTLRDGGFEIDTGAFAVSNLSARMLALIEEVGKSESVSSFAATLAIHHGGRLHEIRLTSLASRLRFPLIDWRSKLKLGALSVLPAPDIYDADALARVDDGESAADWGRRRAGDSGYRFAVKPGIELLGASCQQVNAPFAAGLTRAMRNVRPLRLGGGVGAFCEWLAERLDVRLGSAAATLAIDEDGVLVTTADGASHRADAAMIATDAGVAAELLGTAGAARGLRRAEYAPTAHLAIGFPSSAWADIDAEWVVATEQDAAVSTIGLLSRRSPQAVPPGAEVLDIYFSPSACGRLSDAELVEAAKQAIRHLLGKALPRPGFEMLFRQARGLSAPAPGSATELLATRASLPRQVAVVGDWVSYGGVELAVRSGEWGAARIAALA